MRYAFLIVSIAGVLSAFANAASVQRPDGSRIAVTKIDSTATQLMQAAHVTGMGIAIFHRGKVAYLKAYGSRDTEKQLPLTPNSVMTAASLSKSIGSSRLSSMNSIGSAHAD